MILYNLLKFFFIIKTKLYFYFLSRFSYIDSIKVINMENNTLYTTKIKDISIKNNQKLFYIIKIWNREEMKYMNYFINKTLYIEFIKNGSNYSYNHSNFINNIYNYHKKYVNTNIFSILINNEDVTDIFYTYKRSLSIPNNLSINVLYLYYCYHKYNTSNSSNSINRINTNFENLLSFKIVDYELNEKEYTFGKYL